MLWKSYWRKPVRGSIVNRYKGSYSIVLDLGTDPDTGRRRQKWVTVRGNKKDAERRLSELLHQLDTGTFTEPSRVTVAKYLSQWAENYAVVHTSPRTAESYQNELKRHIIPALGSIRLSDLRPQHVEKYYADALTSGRKDGKGGLSARTILYHHRILSEALNHAVRTGLLARNVCKAVTPPRPTKPRINTLAYEDIPHFLQVAQNSTYYYVFITALLTGMRLGEILALRWRNVDLVRGMVSVVETLHVARRSWDLRQPKSPHSRRQVALPQSLVAQLEELRTRQEEQRGMLGTAFTDDVFVFAHADGKPFGYHSVSKEFAHVMDKAGLPHIRFHDLRHTHATLLLRAGVHGKVVSERLGHASVAFTLDTYSHVLPGLQENAAEKLDTMIRGNVSNRLAIR